MSYLGSWKIDDNLTFCCNTHDPDTGVATDADAVPTYRVYEDETGAAILTGSMAKLDDANTVGFYSEQIALTAANGFEKGKCYTIYITATVDSDAGTMHHTFQMEAEVDANSISTYVTPLDGSITAAKIAAGAIDADAIADNAIDAGAMATGAIDANAIADNAIDVACIATNAISAGKIGTGAIDSDALADSAVQEIADAVLKRGVANVEASADMDSLAAVILAMLHSSISGTTWTIKRTDDSTTFDLKDLTTDSGADPVTSVADP